MYQLALLANDSLPSWLEQLLEPQRISLLIPVVAIVGGITYATVVAVIRHRERMAKIEQGIDPDAKDEADKARPFSHRPPPVVIFFFAAMAHSIGYHRVSRFPGGSPMSSASYWRTDRRSEFVFFGGRALRGASVFGGWVEDSHLPTNRIRVTSDWNPFRCWRCTMNYLTVLAQSEGGLPLWLTRVTGRERLGPIVFLTIAIVGSLTYVTIIAIIRHRERMAKLEQGIDPDAKQEPK